MKIAVLTSGILPVPSVEGGAVENLIDFYLDYNDKHHQHDITIYSIFNPLVKRYQALQSSANHYRYINSNTLFAKIGNGGDPTDVRQIGGPNYPIYINTQGIPQEANKYAGGTKVILNDSNLAGQDASFYAPTTKPSMTVLYSNKGNPITQDSTTITLTDTFNNFDFIEIIFSISSSNVSNATNSVIISSRSYNSMVSSSYPYELNVSSKDNNKNITLWGGYSNKVLNITKTFNNLYLEIVGIKLPIFN